MGKIDFRIVISLEKKSSGSFGGWHAIQCAICRKFVRQAIVATLEIQEKSQDRLLCPECLKSLEIASKFYRFGQIQHYAEKHWEQETSEPAKWVEELSKAIIKS